jgi:hypothetical protein
VERSKRHLNFVSRLISAKTYTKRGRKLFEGRCKDLPHLFNSTHDLTALARRSNGGQTPSLGVRASHQRATADLSARGWEVRFHYWLDIDADARGGDLGKAIAYIQARRTVPLPHRGGGKELGKDDENSMQEM